MPSFPRLLPPVMLTCLLLAACDRATPSLPPGTGAAAGEAPPAPRALLEPDASNATIERAAPPTLPAVALGGFAPGNAAAEAVTGAIEIEDTRITGANGASFVTERVAIVRGGDEFSPGQRYADVMMVDAAQPVELRRVIEETMPDEVPGNAFCGSGKTSYLAMASDDDGDATLVKMIGLQGPDIPAANAQGTTLCASTVYEATR